MTISTYRIEYDEDGLELKYLLKLDRSTLSDQDLIDILGNTCSSIEAAIADADDNLELAVAKASRDTAIRVAFELADVPGAQRHAASDMKRYDGWAGDDTTFEFLKIQLNYDAERATVTKIEEEPAQ